MKKILMFLNWIINTIHGITIHRTSVIKIPYKIWNASRLQVGKNVFISENAYFAITVSKQISTNSLIVKIGDGTCIGGRFFVAACNSVLIGEKVLISENVTIVDHNHGFDDRKRPIIEQPLTSKGPVSIGNGSFIGVNAVILPGIRIGENAVIAASAVVTHDVPSFTIVAGNPAKIIKRISPKYS